MSTEKALPLLLGAARHQAYVEAAGGDLNRAAELYEWSTKLSGAWHSHIGYIEVAVRNTIDRELVSWNTTQVNEQGSPYGTDWTACAAPALYSIVGTALEEARRNARKEAKRRPQGHARKGVQPNHDDVVAQLPFGAWARLVGLPSNAGNVAVNANQSRLWMDALHQAFPGADPGDQGRVYVARQLEGVRRLRNRIAHHDNLLSVDTSARLNGSLALLARIHADFPSLVMGSNSLRHLAAADPRLRWSNS